MAGYTTDQAENIFRQFSPGDPNYTLYEPDGTPADTLNTHYSDTPESSLDYWSTHPAELAAWQQRVAQENAAWKAAHPNDSAPAPGWLDSIENEIKAMIPTLPPFQWPALPWGWIGVAAITVLVLPAFVHELSTPAPSRGSAPPSYARRRRRRR